MQRHLFLIEIKLLYKTTQKKNTFFLKEIFHPSRLNVGLNIGPTRGETNNAMGAHFALCSQHVAVEPLYVEPIHQRAISDVFGEGAHRCVGGTLRFFWWNKSGEPRSGWCRSPAQKNGDKRPTTNLDWWTQDFWTINSSAYMVVQGWWRALKWWCLPFLSGELMACSRDIHFKWIFMDHGSGPYRSEICARKLGLISPLIMS